jgi:hypothetical protein
MAHHMAHILRGDGSGFVAGSVIALATLVGIFVLTTAL